MKIRYSNSRQSGSTLLLTVVATGIIGIMLASYLTLVNSQNMAGMRSQAWNSTIPVIEAGIEDAITHLNTHGSTNILCDGWVLLGNRYIMQRTVGDNYYNVCIYNYTPGISNQSVIIESRGFVKPPVLVALGNGPLMAAVSIPETPDGYLGRGIRATCRKDAIFSKGLVAKGQIDMNGNNIATDSFDSLDPNYSNNGRYSAAKAKDNGDVATNYAVTNSVNVGNANIWGRVSTGPNGTVKIGSNGSVGNKAWHAGNNSGAQTGYVTDDMNVNFPDPVVPFSSGYYTSIPSGSVGGTSYDYVVSSGNYKVSSLSMSSKDKLIVTGDATLWLPNGFDMSGQSQIEIAAGASLKVYAGTSGSIGGNGIVNANDASKFIFYGLPSMTTLSFSGNAAFTGAIYAPNAAFSMNGGGNNTYDFVGASVTKTVTMNGHFNFHYDEALKNLGPGRGFVLTSWNEMTPTEVRDVPIP